MARHKWNGKVRGESSGYAGGHTAGCMNCECVKEIIHGRITYFLNDTLTDKAPPCEGEKFKVSMKKPTNEAPSEACANTAVSNSATGQNLFEALMDADLGRCD